MNDIQDDLDAVGLLAADLKSKLGTIDQSFTDSSSGKKNRALQLDPRRLFEDITGRKIKADKAQQLINEQNIRVTDKSVEFIPPTQLPNVQPEQWRIEGRGINHPVNNLNNIQKEPLNQLELGLDIPTKKQETYNNLYDLADLIKKRMDRLENDLVVIRNIVKEIKINTTKRSKPSIGSM